MERTRVALDRARKQREARQRTARESDTAAPTATIQTPEYQSTRVLVPSSERLRKSRVVAGLPRDANADTFRILRTQVLLKLSKGDCTTLAICSPGEGEGKTLTSANLAVSLAMDLNHTVLLVDLDLRKPSIHSVFDVVPEKGLDDYLMGIATISDCLINPGIDRLVLFPVRASLGHSSEMLSAPRMAQLAQELKERYRDRIIIYDMPPLLATDDCLVFMRHVEACLLVVQEGKTPRQDIERSVELLKDYNMLGTVLNKSSYRQTATYSY